MNNKIYLAAFKNQPKQFLVRLYALLGTTLLLGLGLAIGALLFFAWLADEMLEGDTRAFDETLRASVHQLSAPALTALMQTASFVGSTLFLVILGAAVFIIFWLLKRRRAAMLFAVTTLGSTVLLITLKTSFQRARPDPFFENILPSSYSFPSGHALSALCFYGVLAAIITARLKNHWWRAGIWIIAGLLIALVGFSRVYLGVHYPSDVIAGYAAALVWVVTVAIGDRVFFQPKQI